MKGPVHRVGLFLFDSLQDAEAVESIYALNRILRFSLEAAESTRKIVG
jgi:hypothetical protein